MLKGEYKEEVETVPLQIDGQAQQHTKGAQTLSKWFQTCPHDKNASKQIQSQTKNLRTQQIKTALCHFLRTLSKNDPRCGATYREVGLGSGSSTWGGK